MATLQTISKLNNDCQQILTKDQERMEERAGEIRIFSVQSWERQGGNDQRLDEQLKRHLMSGLITNCTSNDYAKLHGYTHLQLMAVFNHILEYTKQIFRTKTLGRHCQLSNSGESLVVQIQLKLGLQTVDLQYRFGMKDAVSAPKTMKRWAPLIAHEFLPLLLQPSWQQVPCNLAEAYSSDKIHSELCAYYLRLCWVWDGHYLHSSWTQWPFWLQEVVIHPKFSWCHPWWIHSLCFSGISRPDLR